MKTLVILFSLPNPSLWARTIWSQVEQEGYQITVEEDGTLTKEKKPQGETSIEKDIDEQLADDDVASDTWQ